MDDTRGCGTDGVITTEVERERERVRGGMRLMQ